MSIHTSSGPSETLTLIPMSALVVLLLATLLAFHCGSGTVIGGGPAVACHSVVWLSDRSCMLCGAC